MSNRQAFGFARTAFAGALFITLFAPVSRAGVVSVPGSFTGNAQTASYNIKSSNGSYTISGSGTLNGDPVALTPDPQSHSLLIDPNPTVGTTHPVASATSLNLDDHTGELTSFDGLALNLVGGSTIPLTIVPTALAVTINGNPIDLPITASITVRAVSFNSGHVDITGNSFAAIGSASANIDATISVAGITVLQETNSFLPAVSVNFGGTVSTSILPGASPHGVHLAFDGSGGTAVNYGIAPGPINLNLGTLNFAGTIGFDFILLYQANFHLETDIPGVVVPEPSGFLIAGLGLLGLIAIARRR